MLGIPVGPRPYRRVIWLIYLLSLETVGFATILRFVSCSEQFRTFQSSLRFVALALVGSAPWPDITDLPPHEFVVFIIFLSLHFGMVCFSLAIVLELIESHIRRATCYSREKLKILSLRTASNSDSSLTSKDTDDSWVKNRFPGWYYKVVVPKRTFRKKVQESMQSEAIERSAAAVTHPIPSSGKKDLLASLNAIPTDFQSNLDHIKADFRSQTQSINERLSGIQALVEDLNFPKHRTELIMNR